jgi:WD40 repeat protein
MTINLGRPGRVILAAIFNGAVLMTGCLPAWPGERWVTALAYDPSGQSVAAASHNVVQVWDRGSQAAKQTLSDHFAKVQTVVFSADGNTLVTGHESGEIKFWDAKRLNSGPKLVLQHPDGVHCLAISRLLLASSDSSYPSHIRVWNMATGDYSGAVKFWDLDQLLKSAKSVTRDGRTSK